MSLSDYELSRKERGKEMIEQYKKMVEEDKENLIKDINKYSIIDFMLEKGYIPFVYNGCYGGEGMSLEAYHLNGLLNKDDNNRVKTARIILYLWNRANGDYSKPIFDFVKNDYHKIIHTEEYNGLESISLNIDVYKLMKIEEITNSNITSDKKILKIKMILNLYNVEDVIIEYEDI